MDGASARNSLGIEIDGPPFGLTDPPTPRRRSDLRPIVEFLVLLTLGIVLVRSFVVEAYVVPTGSMATTLLGAHQDWLCPNCEIRFAVGLDEQGILYGRPVCPNCGFEARENAPSSVGPGDRLLVQKHFYRFRPPRRWEVAVFRNPEEPTEAYVKRVVGLPGESVEIRHGDLYINGRIARKTLAEQRALRVLVFDQDHPPHDADRYPRWIVHHGDRPSQWWPRGTAFVRVPIENEPDGPTDWLEYHHWRPTRKASGPVRDFVAYNGGESGGENRVEDLMLTARVAVGPTCRAVRLRLGSWSDRLVLTIPVDGRGMMEGTINGRRLSLQAPRSGFQSSAKDSPGFQTIEASVFDRRLTVALDGRRLFEPVDLDDEIHGPISGPNPLAIGLDGGSGEVRGLRVDRDVYYTASLQGAPRRAFAVGEPYQLGPGEYFVLGDNSPVSNDSRFWSGSPVVRIENFLGKPFLIHLPGRAFPWKVFGRDVYWIPDPREIRYIR